MASITALNMAQQIGENFWYLPSSLNSTNVGDKIMKFALQTLPCNEGVAQDFRDAITVYAMVGWVSTVKWFQEQKSWMNQKAVAKATLLGAQVILLYKGLDRLGILGLFAANLGKHSIFASIHPLLSLNLAKDVLIGVYAGFSILSGWEKQEKNLKKFYQEKNADNEREVVNQEIALTADKAKFAFISLSVASTFQVVDFSTVLVTTSYGVLTMGMFANLIGATFAICALSKAINEYQNQNSK